MRNQLSAYLDNSITTLLLVVAGLTPLLFLSHLTEFFEMPKLVFLVVTTLVLIGLWIFSWIVKGKVIITRTPLDIPLLLLLVAILLSTYFSPAWYTAIYGNFPRVHGSAVSWVTYILLYFVTASHLKGTSQIKALLYVLYGSAVIVSLISLLSYFHLYFPVDFAQSANFTPTGSSFSTAAFLILLLPLPLLSIINPNKFMPSPLAILLAILFAVTVVLVGSISGLVVLLLTFVGCLLATKPTRIKKTLFMFLVPSIVTALVLALAYVPFPGNGLQQMAANFPKEIQLPLSSSWKISASAFRDTPFLGSGPATYLFDFTTYKPAEFNSYNFWNFSFDSAYNEFLQFFASLGLVGLAALLFLCVVIVRVSWRQLVGQTQEDVPHLIGSALAISGLLSIILLAIHATTLVSIVGTFFVLAALMAAQKSAGKVFEFSMGLKASTADNKQLDLLPVLFFIAFLALAIPGLYRTYNVVAADYYHRRALLEAGKNGNLTYQNLQKAEQLNPIIDLYRVDLAQINFALANAIASQKGPSEASAAGSLTDQDKQTIQTLLTQAINEGRAAVALNPRSSRNWQVLGSLYRNITGVTQNAFAFSLDAYGAAIQRDPLNPMLRLTVGGIYYSAKNYDLAVRFFADAANLKPDYANAYWNMAIALKDKGDNVNAKTAAEKVVSILQQDTKNPDYKRATDFLANLKTASATDSAAKAPAAQTNSALGNQNVPGVNVADLNTPPQVATPAAVQANPEANVPVVTTTPTPLTSPAASAAPIESPVPVQ